MTFFIRNATILLMADLIDTAINAGSGAGTIAIYSGSVPTDADTALGAQTLLAELTFSDPAFGSAADDTPGGLLTADTITADSSADATGTASFFRLRDSDDNVVCQGSVGTSGEDLNFNTVSFVSGSEIDVTAFTILLPESAA